MEQKKLNNQQKTNRKSEIIPIKNPTPKPNNNYFNTSQI